MDFKSAVYFLIVAACVKAHQVSIPTLASTPTTTTERQFRSQSCSSFVSPITPITTNSELNETRVFLVSGTNQLYRHSHLDLDFPNSTQIQDDKKKFLRTFLFSKSRQQREYECINTVRKQSRGLFLPTLPDTHLVVNGTTYLTDDVKLNYYISPIDQALVTSSVRQPCSTNNLMAPILKHPDRRQFEAPTVKIEQQIELENLKIEGYVQDDTQAWHSLHIRFDNVTMKAVYERTFTENEGIVTNSAAEYLTIESIRTTIRSMDEGPEFLIDMSETTEILPTLAEVWMAPVVDEIKNSHTYKEVLQHSEVYFGQHIQDTLRSLVNQVNVLISNFAEVQDHTYSESYLDVVRFSNFSTNFFDRLPLVFYESGLERKDSSSCGLYTFTHFFFIKFKIGATSLNFPTVRFAQWHSIADYEEGVKLEVASRHGIPVKELSLKFEIVTDEWGEPLSMLKKFRVVLKLVFDKAHPEKRIFLKVQQKLNKLLAIEYRENINDLLFGRNRP